MKYWYFLVKQEFDYSTGKVHEAVVHSKKACFPLREVDMFFESMCLPLGNKLISSSVVNAIEITKEDFEYKAAKLSKFGTNMVLEDSDENI